MKALSAFLFPEPAQNHYPPPPPPWKRAFCLDPPTRCTTVDTPETDSDFDVKALPRSRPLSSHTPAPSLSSHIFNTPIINMKCIAMVAACAAGAQAFVAPRCVSRCRHAKASPSTPSARRNNQRVPGAPGVVHVTCLTAVLQASMFMALGTSHD